MPSIPNTKRPLTTVDLVIFTAIDEQLQVLLKQRPKDKTEPFPGLWALPGGFVDIEQDIDLEACALRKLKEKTGVDSPYLEQLGSWGGKKRDPRGWTATHVYYALVPHESVHLEKGANATDVSWYPVCETGVEQELAFDHKKILATGIERLRNKAEYTSLPVYLLPKEFTLPELQQAYEVVLGRPVEKSAFRTRVMSSEMLKESNGMRTGPFRPAQLYTLKSFDTPVFFPRTFSPRNC
jgi:8-oxo-dGTP diphosphatase